MSRAKQTLGIALAAGSLVSSPAMAADEDADDEPAGTPTGPAAPVTSTPGDPTAPPVNVPVDPPPGTYVDNPDPDPPEPGEVTQPPAGPAQPSPPVAPAPAPATQGAPVPPAPPAAPPPVVGAPETTRAKPGARRREPRLRAPRRRTVAGAPAVSPAPQQQAAAAPVVQAIAPAPEVPRADGPPARERPRSPEGTHLVRSGESLWSIAEAQLPPGTATAEIARLVERLYRLNVERIGANPDLLAAGTRLRLR